MIIECLSRFDANGVWKNYRNTDGVCFAKKTLIYGLNGSGKTTLSRALNSVSCKAVDEKLPDQTSFEFILSDGSKISADGLENPFGDQILVFNTDFIERNIQWSDGQAVGIAYIAERNVRLKAEYDDVQANLEATKAEEERSQAKSDVAKKAISQFKTATAKQIRELAPSNSYTQSYDAKKIDPLYSIREYTSEDNVSDSELKRLQGTLLQNSPLDKIEIPENSIAKLSSLMAAVIETLQQSPSGGISEAFKDHSEMVGWIESGLEYHKSKSLNDCLFCGNNLSRERLNVLEKLFDKTWRSYANQLELVIDEARALQNSVRNFVNGLPDKTRFQQIDQVSAETHLADLSKSCVLILEAINDCLEVLNRKKFDPSISDADVDAKLVSNVTIWVTEFEQTLSKINAIKDSHNRKQDKFIEEQESAFKKIEQHVLAQRQTERACLYKRAVNADNAFKSAKLARAELLTRKNTIKSQLSDHGLAAKKINEMLRMYLGHAAIHLEAVDEGFKLVRPDKSAAQNLSEGEKTALAFCYFLTLLEAEGRDAQNLVVVIDDPISSLDTTAQTHSFSLLARLTKRCRQTIILTHNLPFMNMVKREFQKFSRNDPSSNISALLMLDCCVTDVEAETRITRLVQMDELLVKNDSDYHYQFKIVSAAAAAGSSHHHFLLPNATRKLLEMFTAFWSPHTANFAEALMSNHEKFGDEVDIRSLERLIQIESHGSIAGMLSPSTLTVEEAINAAKAAMKLIESVAPAHFKAMKKLVERI